MHYEESPLAGTQVKLRDGLTSLYDFQTGDHVTLSEQTFRVIDWWDRIHGSSWSESQHKVAIDYSIRTLNNGAIPDDDDSVLYGYVDDHEVLVHITEIGEL